MAKWWQLWAILIVGLAGPSAARAQGVFANNPQPHDPPQFAPGITLQKEDINAFNNEEDTPPNAFQDDCRPHRHLVHRVFDWFHEPEKPDCPLMCWLKFDYLMWNVTGSSIGVPLATTASGTPNLASNNGSLDQPGTVVLYGPADVDLGTLKGFKLTLGTRVLEVFAVEFSIFGFPDQNKSLFSDTSNADKVLSRPVFATNLPTTTIPNFFSGAETVFVSGFGPSPSNFYTGTITVSSAFNFWGLEFGVFAPLFCGDTMNVYGEIGYRYLHLEESITIGSSTTPTFVTPGNSFGGVAVGNDTTTVFDFFQTTNQFHGARLGLRAALALHNRLTLTLDGKLGIGATIQTLTINGESTLIDPNGTVTLPGGILALPSNMGTTTREVFSVVPEFDAYLGFQVNPNLQLFLGYNLMYWANVIRPGEQISRSINTTQAPTDINYDGSTTGPPNATFNTSNLLVNGVSIGILIGY